MRSDDNIVEREQAGKHIIVDDTVGLVFIEVFALFFVDVQSCRSDWCELTVRGRY